MKTPTGDKTKRKKKRQPWLTRVNQTLLLRGPRNREQLIHLLRISNQRKLLDAQALKMIEGVLQISNRQVRDIMVPSAKMTFILSVDSLSEILPKVIDSGHSRFPVLDISQKKVSGLLLAKDLLKYNPLLAQHDEFNIHNIIRPAVFIPESKRLDILLEEFQHKHYHMAIVVDEYGAVSGLVTIEDVLEEIVGEIEDEYDDSEVFVHEQTPNQFKVKALMPIESFNSYFNTKFTTEQFDTIGGFIANRFGYLPKRGASITLSHLQFKVLQAENRQIRLLQVKIKKPHNSE